MGITLQKWGNSQGIRIPKHVIHLLQWSNEDELELIAENNQLVLKKINKKERRKTIDELFDNYHDSYHPVTFDWDDEPRGKEVW